MEAQIRVVGGTPEELSELGSWLAGEKELRGQVRAVSSQISETELGAIPDLLTVALGAGGAGPSSPPR